MGENEHATPEANEPDQSEVIYFGPGSLTTRVAKIPEPKLHPLGWSCYLQNCILNMSKLEFYAQNNGNMPIVGLK